MTSSLNPHFSMSNEISLPPLCRGFVTGGSKVPLSGVAVEVSEAVCSLLTAIGTSYTF